MKNNFKNAFALAVITFTSISANASLIGIEDNGDYITDTANQLDWLDVSLTTNLSFDYVSSQLGVGGQFAGYRYATGEEFFQLISTATNTSDAYAVGNNYLFQGEDYDQLAMLVEFLGGPTFEIGNGQTYLHGIIADEYDADWHFTATIGMSDTASGFRAYASAADGGRYLNNQGSSSSGSFLVRQADMDIPEPVSLSLFGLGLAGLGFARRQKFVTISQSAIH